MLALNLLSARPSHASREVVLVYGALNSCDPGDIFDTIRDCKVWWFCHPSPTTTTITSSYFTTTITSSFSTTIIAITTTIHSHTRTVRCSLIESNASHVLIPVSVVLWSPRNPLWS
jgi:hypothetical protein